MISCRNYLRLLFTVFLVATPVSSSAITIDENIGRLLYPRTYEYDMGRARVGLILGLSTQDSWNTAKVDVTVRSHQQAHDSQIYFYLADPSNASIVASDLTGSGSITYDDPNYDLSTLFLTGRNNDRFSFTISSVDPGYTVWDALSTRFGFWHGFFGNEYENNARLSLTYPGITSYTIQLGEAAAVPVPPAILLAMGALGSLALASRKRKKSRGSPAKTAKVPAEA